MNSPAETRAQIDAAIAAEQTGRALSLLKQLWQEEPTLASAPFVLDRFAKVPNAPPTGASR
ncbi:MAG: hypothetical protein IH898_10295 [Planctomycetes bacterium]|nr:hypothetical protein [Planctomycetota bacterium]